jgi:hypothetical protein
MFGGIGALEDQGKPTIPEILSKEYPHKYPRKHPKEKT